MVISSFVRTAEAKLGVEMSVGYGMTRDNLREVWKLNWSANVDLQISEFKIIKTNKKYLFFINPY